ncbi:MAG TPA: Gfo/Idh/MocA family oxidoreductase [Dehalococcoidia bacterium]|nr:Gfo/Idh/MocA family oxidoreductase [Dehalococcoidia bacterium]
MAALRWGVLGVSGLVGRLAVLPALQASPTAELVAIASRSAERAAAEASRFGARRSYASYQPLLADPEVEAVYIPLPNALHREWALKAAAAGKHVLCEKPLSCSAADAREMAEACARAGVVLMEAFMTPFHRRFQEALALAERGELGELRFIRTVFSFPASDPGNHRWLKEMGGGSLLDVGVYCLTPAIVLAGRPPRKLAAARVEASSGVDASFSGWLDFGDGLTASFETSFQAPERQLLEVTGTRARLWLERAFTAGPLDTDIHIQHANGDGEILRSLANDSYLAMVEHFAAVVRGKASIQRPPSDSILVLELMERLEAAARTAE